MKVHLVSLGCPKNLVDSEKILGALGTAGASVSASPDDCDAIIINTCGFIKPALEETEHEIKQAGSSLQGSRRLYVYGCAVNRYGRELKAKFPRVNGWFRIEEKNSLVQTIESSAAINSVRLPLTPGYAYLKIAEGCSNNCTYCTIPLIKGPFRSFNMDSLVNEAHELAQLGIKEIVLIAQDTSRYGIDMYARLMLSKLIHRISEIPEINWIRVMYAHPKSIDDTAIQELKTNDKVCKYIDLPIQHISNRILKLMNRNVTKTQIATTINKLKKIKGFSIRTTVIAGFPTENDKEFNELMKFLINTELDWIGVFPYFNEQGTQAAQMPQLPDDVINERYEALLAIQRRILNSALTSKVGKTYDVLIDAKNDYYQGHTEFTAPDIDSAVLIKDHDLRIGTMYKIKITAVDGYDLIGQIDTNEPSRRLN